MSPHPDRADDWQRPERTDGFVPIESYGLIGDGESVALVARDGAIAWWATPAMDCAPVIAALDPAEGGAFLGNTRQGRSHLALLNAVALFRDRG